MAAENDDTPAVNSVKTEQLAKSWLNRIYDAQKREKNYRKDGRRIVDLYEAKEPSRQPFAILYSNTETLAPAVYNARPVPIVDRRFKDNDPVGKLAAEVGTRIDKYLIESESVDCDNFDELMQDAVLNTILVNRGNIRWKYEADTSAGEVKNEGVYGETVKWDKFFHGYARTWKKVPWIGFEWDMTKEEARANFGEVANKLQFEGTQLEPQEGQNTGESREELTGVNLAKIYEIWDKESRKVYFFSPNAPREILKSIDDPLELEGFFPIPKPMNFMRKITTLVPTPLYIQYESQAKELNQITRRLKHIIEALKVRGFYNNTIEGIEKVLQADENTLVGVENMASMPEGMGMDKMIWLMPLNDLVGVAQSLYTQREQVKQVIYEITGISDILRGASVASETATAQNIKNQWGTLRLKKMQKEVQRYCRDALRLMLEIAVTKMGQKTLAAMTGVQLPTQDEKLRAKFALDQFMTRQQQIQQMAQQPPTPGQPPQQIPQPQEPPPELQKILSTPSWEDVLGLLRNDTLRNYKVDIETNSTLDAEAAQDKQDIAELLNAMSQWMNGLGPLVENGSLSIDVAKEMLLVICRRYTFGPQLEDAINSMKAPEPKSDPAAEAKQQEMQMKMQMEQQKGQLELQKMQAELEADKQRLQLEAQKMQMELQMAQAEFELKKQELQLQAEGMMMKSQAAAQAHQFKMQSQEESFALKQKQTKEAAAAKPEKEPSNAAV